MEVILERDHVAVTLVQKAFKERRGETGFRTFSSHSYTSRADEVETRRTACIGYPFLRGLCKQPHRPILSLSYRRCL